MKKEINEENNKSIENEENILDKESIKTTKKINIITIILAVLLIFVVLIKFANFEQYLPKSYKDNKNISSSHTVDGGTINDSALYIKCALSDEKGTKKIENASNYGVNDYLLCNMELYTDYIDLIDYMSFEINSKNIELTNASSATDVWEVNKKQEKEDTSFISITSNSKINKDNIKDLKLHLHIKNNENVSESYKFEIKDLKIHRNEDEKEIYTHIMDKTVELNTSNERYYLDNTTIIFERKQQDGSYKKINEYKCKSPNSCVVNMAAQAFDYHNENSNIVMISDDNPEMINVLFDYDKGIIGTYGGYARWLYPREYQHDKAKYIYIKDEKSNNYGIIDANGKIIHEFSLGDIKAVSSAGMLDTAYSIEDDMIVDQKDNKYGIIKIASNDKIIDYEFDLIRLIVKTETKKEENSDKTKLIKSVNNKYFKAKLDNKWYLYSFDTKEKVTSKGYDDIFVANDSIIIALEDKYLYIKDYQGNNLTEDKIEDLSKEHPEYLCCGLNPGVEVETKDNKITIKTYKNNDWNDYNHYEYNISNKSLTKVK